MSQQRCQHGLTTGRYLWLVMAVAVGLVLDSQAAAAEECAREMPLPADVRLTALAPEVPAALARFAGAWIGASESPRKSDPLCHTLIVEKVFANGYARVIYSYSSSVYYGVHLPGFLRATGRIIDGELRFQVRIRERPQIAYRVAGETLEDTFSGPDGAIRLLLSRVAALRIQASTMFRARRGCAGRSETLPGFSVAFITQGDQLVPLVRDIVAPPGSFSPRVACGRSPV